MNNKLYCILAFAAGAVIGSAVTCKVIKSKYEKLAQEEIDSVKEAFSTVDKPSEDEPEDKQIDIYEYAAKLAEYRYAEAKEEEDEEDPNKPYLIPPEEFDMLEGYEAVSLLYYSDGVLADDDDNVIYNEDELVGRKFANWFGEYEDDAVHVRNEKLKTDFEILMSLKKYSDVIDDD